MPVRGNLVPDAHVAAILFQHGVRTLYMNDRDFRKFESLDVRDPFSWTSPRLDRHRGRLAAPDAQRGDAALKAPRPERAEQGHEDPRPGSADRVAEGAGAAVDVDFFVRQREVPHRRHRHDGKGLVDLVEVD